MADDSDTLKERNIESGKDSPNIQKLPLHKRSVCIMNLPSGVTEEEIEPLFKEYGTIDGIRIPLNSVGLPKGHAFVQYSSQGQALKAVNALKEIELHGKKCPLRLSNAPNPKQNKQMQFNDRSSKEYSPYERDSRDYTPYDRDTKSYGQYDREYMQREQRPLVPPPPLPLPPQPYYDPRINIRRIPAQPMGIPMRQQFPQRAFIDPRSIDFIREQENSMIMQQIERNRILERERTLLAYERQLKQKEIELSLRDHQIQQHYLLNYANPITPDVSTAIQAAHILQMHQSAQISQQQLLQAQLAQMQSFQANDQNNFKDPKQSSKSVYY